MRHYGLDVHQKMTQVCCLDDETGEVSRSRAVPTAQLVSYLGAFPGPKRLILECGGQSRFLAGRLQSLAGAEVIVVDAGKARRALAGLHPGKKTDKLDARGLARLSAQGCCEAMAVWLPDPATADLRALSRTRQALVEQCTALQNQMRAFLRAQGLTCESTELLSQKAQRQLDELAALLSPIGQECLARLRQTLLSLKRESQALEKQLVQWSARAAACQRLMTIPGCGPLLATMIVAEIGDPTRFAEAKQLRSYAGLTPSVYQSGERSYTGRLTKGNTHLKYALVMLAQHFTWQSDFQESRLKRSYYRCLNRHGPQPAKVALARHLCDILFALLRDESAFQAELLAA
jgi:transposase